MKTYLLKKVLFALFFIFFIAKDCLASDSKKYISTKKTAKTNFTIVESGEISPIIVSNDDYSSVLKVVNHESLEMFFADVNEVLNEQTIIQKQGKIVKPDRIVIAEEENVFLLDYKTGAHNEKYKKQLEQYEAAIESMGLKIQNKTLVYIGEEIEVVRL